MSWRRQEQEACRLIREACRGVGLQDVGQVAEESPLEVPEPPVIGAKLSLQTLPRNQGRLLEIAHPVGEPDVEVDGEGRSL